MGDLFHGVRVGHHEQRVSIRRALGDGVGADDRAAAGLVLDHERLAEGRRQLFSEGARVDIGGTAGRERHDDLHGFRRPGLGAGDAGQGEGEDGGDSGGEARHGFSRRVSLSRSIIRKNRPPP